VKRLENVPFKDFQNSDLFIRILSAETSGLITVTIDVNDSLEETLELYQSKAYDASATAWNKQRRMILNEAFHKHLHPMLKRECRARLEKEGFEVVVRSAAKGLMEHVGRAPCEVQPGVFSEEQLEDLMYSAYRGPMGKHVMALYVPENREEAVFVAVVDKLGCLVAQAKLSFFTDRMYGGQNNSQQADVQKVRDLVMAWRPGVIAVSAVPRSFKARAVMEQVQNLVKPLADGLRATLPGVVPKVLWIDGRVSRCFGLGPVGQKEMPAFPSALRSAVSLARVAQDPLLE
jgi:transcriptional accessory protein Tex/SPT6